MPARPFLPCPLCGVRVKVGRDHACSANAKQDAADKAAHAASLAESSDATDENESSKTSPEPEGESKTSPKAE